MKNRLFILMAVMLSGVTAFAQSLTEGFYRVQNNGSGRYLYVKDCTGSVSTLGSDMGACELWPKLENAISDPGSVMYLEAHGSAWDITAQATGVYAMIQKYMSINVVGDYCLVYNSGQYLYEIGVSDFNPDQGIIGPTTASDMPGKSAYRCWSTPKIDSSTDNYFGFKPTVTAGGKYYAPFYADFAYTPLAGQKTWYVSQVDKEHAIAVVKEISGSVAGQQPVFVECASSSTVDNKVDLLHTGGNSASDNLLKGLFFDNAERSNFNHSGKNPAVVVFDPSTMRVLGSNAEGKLAFVSSSENIKSLEVMYNGEWQYKDCLPHNTSYLTVDADCPATLTVMTEKEYEDYIDSITPKYILGDVNGDGKVTISDVPCIIRFVVKGDTSGLNKDAADMNGDGKVTISDVPVLVDKIVNKK